MERIVEIKEEHSSNEPVIVIDDLESDDDVLSVSSEDIIDLTDEGNDASPEHTFTSVKFICDNCNYTSQSWEQFKNHMMWHETNDGDISNVPPDKRASATQLADEMPIMIIRAYLRQYIRTIKRLYGRRFMFAHICNICGYRNSNYIPFKWHMEIHGFKYNI